MAFVVIDLVFTALIFAFGTFFVVKFTSRMISSVVPRVSSFIFLACGFAVAIAFSSVFALRETNNKIAGGLEKYADKAGVILTLWIIGWGTIAFVVGIVQSLFS